MIGIWFFARPLVLDAARVSGLLLTGMIAVGVYRLALRGHELDWSVIDLLTLGIPTGLALAVVIFGYRLAGR
jgi:hypothetical protein